MLFFIRGKSRLSRNAQLIKFIKKNLDKFERTQNGEIPYFAFGNIYISAVPSDADLRYMVSGRLDRIILRWLEARKILRIQRKLLKKGILNSMYDYVQPYKKLQINIDHFIEANSPKKEIKVEELVDNQPNT